MVIYVCCALSKLQTTGLTQVSPLLKPAFTGVPVNASDQWDDMDMCVRQISLTTKWQQIGGGLWEAVGKRR